jgi:hypothetical protein
VGNGLDARVALLQRLFDHAPLFPPASLPLEEAVREDERARESSSAFALGRLVWPESRLEEAPPERRLSVVLDAPFKPDPRVEAVEVPPGGDVDSVTALAPEVYVEVPLDDQLDRRLGEVKRLGLRAKVRCSGDTTRLGWFMLECNAQRVVFKATAGLHHAIRSRDEHGFLNLLAAVVFGDEGDPLWEEDPRSFELNAERFCFRGRSASADEIASARRRFHSIGTCSFFEPVEELEALGILPL